MGAHDGGLLEDVVLALAGGQSLPELLQPCAEALVRHLDVALARIWLTEPDQGQLILQASAGLDTRLDGPQSRVPVGAFNIGRIASSRRSAVINDLVDDDQVSDPDWVRRHGIVAFAGLPLITGDDVVGVVAMLSRQPLDERTVGSLGVVARALALGVRRLQAEHDLRVERDTTAKLQEIGVALSQELDLERLIQEVTDAATDVTGAQFGAFFYNVVQEGAESYVLYTLSGRPRAAFENFPLPRNTAIFSPTFNGEGVVRLDDVTADPRYGHNPPYHGMPQGHLPVRSYLAVPVIARNREVLGGLFFGHAEPGVFTALLERLVVGIAGHAAIAIENARLYERERLTAVTLQRTLLPTGLPDVPGVSLGAAYLPASHHNEIGGDWYDALALPGRRVAITIGDVGGHDVRAAGIMGQLRSAIRMAVLAERQPADVLARIDRYLAIEEFDRITTAVQAELHLDHRRLVVASAGHPPPLVIGPDGDVRFLDMVTGPALGYGLVEATTIEQVAITLDAGTTVVFYTDGLIEQRGASIEDGLDRLHSVASLAVDRDPDALCKHLVEGLVGAADQADDVALLIVTL